MNELIESRSKGIPDPPHEVGIPKDLALTLQETEAVTNALSDDRFKSCTTYSHATNTSLI